MWNRRTYKAICDTCPTPLKSPKSGTNGAHCVPLQNKRSQGLCHGCKRYPRQCVVSKAWRANGRCISCTLTWGKKQHLPQYAASALFVQNLLKKVHLPSAIWAEKRFGGTSLRTTNLPKSAKANDPPVFQEIRRLHNCSTPIPRPGATDPRAKHQASAPSVPK